MAPGRHWWPQDTWVTPEDVEDIGGVQGTLVSWPDPTLLSQMHQLPGTVTGTGTGTWPMVSDTPSVLPGHPLGATLGTREGPRD